MIVVHHLNNSRSQRILWLLEELNTPYRVEPYRRDAKTNLAPSELRAVHPLSKSPVIQDGDLVLAESGAIIEYLLERHDNGRLVPRGAPSACALSALDALCRRHHHAALGGAALSWAGRRRCKDDASSRRRHDRRRARLGRGGAHARWPYGRRGVQRGGCPICSRWNLPHSPGSWTPAMPDCAITSPGCRPGLLTAERWTGVAPTPSMPRARMTPRRSRDQAADAWLAWRALPQRLRETFE